LSRTTEGMALILWRLAGAVAVRDYRQNCRKETPHEHRNA
jgi:hypothetical protein